MDEALRGDARAVAVERRARSRADAGEPIGAWIARQRVLRGLSIEELERRTRIPRRSLERLEAGVFDGDRDAFARGFVRTVALAIGLDADEAVTRMLPEYALAPGGHWRLRLRRLAVRAALTVLVVGGAALIGLVWRSGLVAWPSAARTGGIPAREIVHRHDALLELANDVRFATRRREAPLPNLLADPGPMTPVPPPAFDRGVRPAAD